MTENSEKGLKQDSGWCVSHKRCGEEGELAWRLQGHQQLRLPRLGPTIPQVWLPSSRLLHDLTLLVGLLSPTVGSRPWEGRGQGLLPQGKSHQRLPLLLAAREARKCSLFLAGDKTSKNEVSSQVGGIRAHHPLYQEVW